MSSRTQAGQVRREAAGAVHPAAAGRSGTSSTYRLLGVLLLTLGAGVAVTSLLGPVGIGVLEYRTSPTTLNQLEGSDLAGLVVVAPLSLAAGILALRRHRAAALLALGPAVYAIYTFAQLVVGQEYLRLPGNVDRFFPLLLAVFVLGEAAALLAWRLVPGDLPAPPRRLERAAGWLLLTMAFVVTFGLHLPGMVTAWTDPLSMTEYASSPTPFWLVKLMDLGIVVPAAVAAGVGALRGAPWARRLTYTIVTGYACLGWSVAAMGVVMNLRGDPDASLALTTAFLVFAGGFTALVVRLFRPLLRA